MKTLVITWTLCLFQLSLGNSQSIILTSKNFCCDSIVAKKILYTSLEKDSLQKDVQGLISLISVYNSAMCTKDFLIESLKQQKKLSDDDLLYMRTKLESEMATLNKEKKKMNWYIKGVLVFSFIVCVFH